MNKNQHLMSMLPTAPVAKLNEKEKDAFVQEVFGSGAELICKAKETYEMLKQGMKAG